MEDLDFIMLGLSQGAINSREAKAQLIAWRDKYVAAADNLLADIVKKAAPYGTQDGDFIASYILPTGPIHRAIPYLDNKGIARAELKPSKENQDEI